VEWRISNAWSDESCDSVCWSSGLDCTETCWPADSEGLEEINRAPGLRDICFAVAKGDPSPWHPAKDPQNTLCYWNAGPPARNRCPTVPQTPAAELEANRLIRRLCPCYNATDAYMSTLDCGLGSGAVAVRPAATSTSGGTASSDVPAPSPPTTTISAAARWDCDGMCVDGFDGSDSGLNGGYARIEVAGQFSRWSRQGTRDGGSGYGSTLQIINRDARWRFMEVEASGAEQLVAQAAKYAASYAERPANDRYTASGGDHEVRFYCCRLGPENYSAADTGDDDGSVAGIVLAILGVIAFIAIMGALAYLRCWKYSVSSFSNVKPSKSETEDTGMSRAMPMESAFPSYRREDLESGPATIGRDPSPGTREALRSQTLEQPSPQQSSGSWSRGPLSRNKFGSPIRDPTTTPPPFSNTWSGAGSATPTSRAASEDRSAAAIAAALNGGDYEGPMSAPWPDARAGRQPAPIVEERPTMRNIEIGTEVSLRGMSDATWNGAECTIEDFDDITGLVHVRLPDGRMKAVRAENCVGPGAPLRPEPPAMPKHLERAARSQTFATPQGASPQARAQAAPQAASPRGRTGRSWRAGASSGRGHEEPEQPWRMQSGGAMSSAAQTQPSRRVTMDTTGHQTAHDSALRTTAGAPRSFGPAASSSAARHSNGAPPMPPPPSSWYASGNKPQQSAGPPPPRVRQAAAASPQPSHPSQKGSRPPVPAFPELSPSGASATARQKSSGQQRQHQSPLQAQERRAASVGPQAAPRAGPPQGGSAKKRAVSQGAPQGLEDELARAQRGMQAHLDGLRQRLAHDL